MKKVLIYRNKLLPYSETFIKAQAEALSNWEYMFLSQKIINELPIDKDKVLLIPKRSKHLVFKYILYFYYFFKESLLFYKIKKHHFDLIHAHFGTDGVKVANIAEKLNIPLVITLHGFDVNIYKHVWESGLKGKNKQRYPKALVALSQKPDVHFIAVSEAIKQQAIIYGIPEHKITVLYIGVDTNQFQFSGNGLRTKNILFVGRLVEKKGASLLIKAFSKVYAQYPDARLYMIGTGEELEVNRELTKSLGLPVSFLGAKTRDEVISYLNNARIFCLPSIRAKNGDAEGLGIVILEAQACGVPVVTSALGGATEAILEGKTGFKFTEGNVDELSARIMLLLSDDQMTLDFSNLAVSYIRENFDLFDCTKKLEAYYDSILKID